MGSTGATRSYLNFHHTLCAQTRPLKIQTDFRHSEENNYNKTVFKYSAEKTISITYQITIKEKLYLSKNKKPRISARLLLSQNTITSHPKHLTTAFVVPQLNLVLNARNS